MAKHPKRTLVALPSLLLCRPCIRHVKRPRHLAFLTSTRRLRAEKGAPSASGALTGVKILDLSRVLAAPFSTQILSDYGADVIKVEDIDRGDDTRYWRIKGEDAAWNEDAGPISNYFAAINRNKRSICLNLKQQRGLKVFKALVKDSDVVVENLRPGAMEKLGIGFDVLSEINPRIILASTSGYGASGPFRDRAGYDMIAGAEGGLLHLTGERGRGPVRPGLGLTDMTTGLFMHGAIMGALYARERSGVGQKLDGSLFEAQVALLTNVGLSWLNLGAEAERWGTQHPSVVPYDAFKTRDLYFVCGAMNDKQFQKFCRLLGREELVDDPRFVTNPMRVSHRDELYGIVNKVFVGKTTDEWAAIFEGSGLPYGSVNTMERVFEHPQTEARDMVQEVNFPAAKRGTLRLLGSPVKWSYTAPSVQRRPPLHGEHTDEILAEVGVEAEERDQLRRVGAIK